jgi:hypothetical protein
VSTWIKDLATNSADRRIQKAAVIALTSPNGDKGDLELFAILKSLYQQNISPVSQSAIFGLFKIWGDSPETLSILKDCLIHEDPYMRWPAVKALARDWKDDPDTLPILKRCSQDESDMVRREALAALVKNQVWRDLPEITEMIFYLAENDPYELEDQSNWEGNPRLVALKALITYYPTHPKTIELMHDRAINDPDEQLREWAQQQLKK